MVLLMLIKLEVMKVMMEAVKYTFYLVQVQIGLSCFCPDTRGISQALVSSANPASRSNLPLVTPTPSTL